MEMTGAEVFAETFGGYGVSHVFMVPSIISNALSEMERRTPTRRVVTHGEKSAAYMADGYARASGRPGVCMAQTVGAANLAAGLRDAYLACSPVIAITGGPYKHSRNRHQYQEAEDLPMFKSVTKSTTRIDDIAMVSRVLRQAFRDSTTGMPGPVFVELEGHLGEVLEPQVSDVEVVIESRFAQTPPFRPRADPADVARAAEQLARASRPVIVLGGGARTSGAGAAILELAQRHNIPMVSSMNAKGLVAADHPLYFGVVGLYSRESANRLLSEADVVLFIGSKTGSQVTHSWRVPAPGATVIQIDISPAVMGVNYPDVTAVVGDARECLSQLLEAMPDPTADHSSWVQRGTELAEAWYAKFRPLRESDQVPIRPERLCHELSELLPSDALLVADTGHSGMWTGGSIDLRHEDQDFIRAAGSLGWSLPAALGAKCAAPDRPVVAFMGDGGFYYHMAEIETALRWGLNAVLVVNNNNALNQYQYRESGGKALAGSSGPVPKHDDLWKHQEVDISAVVRAMGAAAFRVEKAADFGSALDSALSADRVSVVEVMTDVTAMAAPGWFPTPA